MIQQLPELWQDWETVRLIGRGSFGTVYEIRRTLIDGSVENSALKVISIPQNEGDVEEMYSEGYDDATVSATLQAHLKSIVSEYTLMRRMDGCANIVNCRDITYQQHSDGIGWDVFIRMELLTPLMKALPVNVSEDAVIRLGKDIANALALCKKNEIVHRDIKPQNIFISDTGIYKLGDFGIAKTIERTMGGTKIGTYKYMAPEVYNNQPYGTSADIYSLGLVLYWLLNERRMPFVPLPPAVLKAGADEQARFRRLSGEAIPAPAHGSERLKRIVLKACAYRPEDRYASASDLLRDLNALTAAPAPAEEEDEGTVGFFAKPMPAPAPKEEKEEGTVSIFTRPEPEKVPEPVPEKKPEPVTEPAADDEATVSLFYAGPQQPAAPVQQPAPVKPAAVNEPPRAVPTPPQATAPVASPEPITAEPPKKKGKKMLLAAIAAVLVIALGIGIWAVARPKEPGESAKTAAGTWHTVALRSDGTVVAVGYNDYGQCNVENWTDIVAISAGDDHTVGLRSDGTVVAVGDNFFGQCDVENWTDIVAISAGGVHTFGLRSDGTVVAVGYNGYGQCNVKNWTDIVAISASYYHTIGLRADGTVVATGSNDSGQCNVENWTDMVAISAGGYHTVGIRADGTVVAVGSNGNGQCNVQDWTDIVAISAGGYHTVGIRADGTVVAVGGNGNGQCNVENWTDIVAISAGNAHTVGVRADGTVVATGWNYHGQCDVSNW